VSNQENNPKICRHKDPIHISYHTRHTKEDTHTIRLKDEIKFLYKKKEKPNNELYNIHLKAAQERGNTWYIILDSIHDPINHELEKK
jgi:hypothetical protein